MKLDVPYYSQLHDVSDISWQSRSCGIVSLAMTLRYMGISDINVDHLIKEGIKNGAYLEGVGWKHNGLLTLARNNGVSAYRKEFRMFSFCGSRHLFPNKIIGRYLINYGVIKIQKSLEQGTPVIVSVYGRFRKEGEPHLIPLTGAKKEKGKLVGFYYHEPNPKEEEDPKNIFVDTATFKKYWRKLAIFFD